MGCGYIQNPRSLSLIDEENPVNCFSAVLNELEATHTEFYLVPTAIDKKLLLVLFSLHFGYLGFGR